MKYVVFVSLWPRTIKFFYFKLISDVKIEPVI